MGKAANILVVDDKPEMLRVVETVLANEGVRLVLASSGAEALRLAMRSDDLTAAIMDVSMPEMNGFELAGLLRQHPRFATTPILFLTGVATEQHQVFQGYEHGAVDYIIKPVEPHILRSKVRVFVELERLRETLEERVRERTSQLEAEVVAKESAQAERTRLEAQLYQAQKLEAVGRLASGVAHDFNNVLATILSCAGLALRALPSDHGARQEIDDIVDTATKSTNLTRQLLAFGTSQLLQPRVVELNALVGSMQRLLARTLRDDIELEVRATTEEAFVKVDPVQMEQAILNLAINARDAMPNGGRLVIETSTTQIAPGSELSPGPYVVLTVKDDGGGMDAATLARIFEPFFTTKRGRGGTGLGLAVVHGFLKQSGGAILVESEPGRGTTFRTCLPRVAAAEVREPEKHDAQPKAGTETILVVEDNDPVRRWLRTLLEKAGYAVIEADGSRAALRLASAHEGPIHLALTDLGMSGMSGATLVEALRGARPEMKAIFISGYADGTLLDDVTLEEGVNFLQKPFTPQALDSMVRATLDAEASRLDS